MVRNVDIYICAHSSMTATPRTGLVDVLAALVLLFVCWAEIFLLLTTRPNFECWSKVIQGPT